MKQVTCDRCGRALGEKVFYDYWPTMIMVNTPDDEQLVRLTKFELDFCRQCAKMSAEEIENWVRRIAFIFTHAAAPSDEEEE